jgi:hypothetical protein
MGGQSSKRKGPRNLAALERSSSKKKYLPANNAATSNGAAGVNGHQGEQTIEDKTAQELPPFTERQKELVMSSWKVVQADIDKVGVSMFIK